MGEILPLPNNTCGRALPLSPLKAGHGAHCLSETESASLISRDPLALDSDRVTPPVLSLTAMSPVQLPPPGFHQPTLRPPAQLICSLSVPVSPLAPGTHLCFSPLCSVPGRLTGMDCIKVPPARLPPTSARSSRGFHQWGALAESRGGKKRVRLPGLTVSPY